MQFDILVWTELPGDGQRVCNRSTLDRSDGRIGNAFGLGCRFACLGRARTDMHCHYARDQNTYSDSRQHNHLSSTTNLHELPLSAGGFARSQPNQLRLRGPMRTQNQEITI